MTSKATKRVCAKCQFEDDTGLKICPRDGSPMTSRGKDPLIGQMIADKYEILSMLGKGGMSVVYKAKHNMMNREVAVKMLRPELVAMPQLLQRFKQESNAVSALRHPNIVTVFDYGLMTATGTPYLIMDFLEGDTLADILKRDKILTPERAIPIFAQACDALAHAHDQGVIHRDIKPANLLIRTEKSGEESLTVFDFGIAKLLGQDGSTIHKLTTSGEVFGSPLYMSPEQCGGEHISKKTDIYSLACVFYECLCGKPPLGGTSPMETLMKHVNEDPPMLSEMAQPAVQYEIPEKLEDAIMQALLKDPAERQIDMREFRDQILEAGNLRILSSSLHLTRENTLAGASEEMLAAVVSQPTRMTSSGSVPTPRRKTTGRSHNQLPAQKSGKTSTGLKKTGGAARTDDGGKKLPMPLIIGIAVVIGFGAMAGVVYMMMHQNEAIVVEPQVEQTEPVKPFDESAIDTKRLPPRDTLQLSQVPKDLQIRVDFEGKLVAGAPTPLLVNPVNDDGAEHTDMKSIVVPVDVKPGDITCVQAANALFKKIFADTKGVEFANVSDEFIEAADIDNIIVQEITFPKEEPTAKTEEAKPASEEATPSETKSEEPASDATMSEETAKTGGTTDEAEGEGDATASDAAKVEEKSETAKTADAGEAAKTEESSGIVKEYILYFKHGKRMIACQFLPLKITETELRKAIKGFIPYLKGAVSQ